MARVRHGVGARWARVLGRFAALSRGYELEELADDLSRVVEKARRLGLATTVYLLSMALIEARESAEAAADGDDDGAD
jgi:hypothetical protein